MCRLPNSSALRYVLATGLVVVTIAGAITTAVVLAGRDSDRPASTIVSGQVLVDGQGVDAYLSLTQTESPLLVHVELEKIYPGFDGEQVAEEDSDAEGRFAIRADLDEASADHLILYATCYQDPQNRLLGCARPGLCVYKALPPLQRFDGSWVVKSTGRPLRVKLRIGVDKPDSPCG